jgi:hypothetical protein
MHDLHMAVPAAKRHNTSIYYLFITISLERLILSEIPG